MTTDPTAHALDGAWGPHDDRTRHAAAIAASGGPLAALRRRRELLRYDGALVDLVDGSDGSLWLRLIHHDGIDGDPEGATPATSWCATHLLLVDDEEAALASLHDGTIPTVETYRLARTIVSERLEADVVGPVGARIATAYRTTRRVVDVDGALAEDPIHRQLRPGASMAFGPRPDAWEPHGADDATLHRWPVPADRVLAAFDGDRIWIGRFPERPDRLHLCVCVADDPGRWIQHRLDFDAADEDAVLDTLASGCAPTMQTYRMARRVLRESVVDGPDGQTLLVEPLDVAALASETPTFANVAEHDRAWPAFARPSGMDGTGPSDDPAGSGE